MGTAIGWIKKQATALHRGWRRLQVFVERGTPTSPIGQEPTECQHCGHVFRGNYCPRCGQSRTVGKGKPQFVRTFRDAYPQLSSNFFRTMIHLFLRPGYMVRDYLRGHRVIYQNPTSTFVVAASIVAICSTLGNDNDNTPTTGGSVITKLNDVVITQMENVVDSKDEYNKVVAMWNQLHNRNQQDGRWKSYGQVVLDKLTSDMSIMLVMAFPLFGFISYRTFRKRTFDGRRLTVMEHYIIYAYLYALYCFIDSIYLLPWFYMAWMYRGIYRLSWWRAAGYTVLVNVLCLLTSFLLIVLYTVTFVFVLLQICA